MVGRPESSGNGRICSRRRRGGGVGARGARPERGSSPLRGARRDRLDHAQPPGEAQRAERGGLPQPGRGPRPPRGRRERSRDTQRLGPRVRCRSRHPGLRGHHGRGVPGIHGRRPRSDRRDRPAVEAGDRGGPGIRTRRAASSSCLPAISSSPPRTPASACRSRGSALPPAAAAPSGSPGSSARHGRFEVLLTGRVLTGQEAYEWGIANRVVPKDDLLAVAEELGRAMLALAPARSRRSSGSLRTASRFRLPRR